jgi:hypothetical protein
LADLTRSCSRRPNAIAPAADLQCRGAAELRRDVRGVRISLFTMLAGACSIAYGELVVVPALNLDSIERTQLVTAARRDGVSAPLAEVHAFEAEPPATLVPTAVILFGPYSLTPTSFSIDAVRCERAPAEHRWRCISKRELTFVYRADVAKSFLYYEDVPKAAAIAIYDQAQQHCVISFADSYELKPDVTYDAKADVYRLWTESCAYEFRFVEGAMQIGARFQYVD